jgi:hypothetical protein
MQTAPLNSISAFLGTAILTIFVVALAESISAGFAGFWGGLPFWLIILFIIYLAAYNFLEECIGLPKALAFFLQMLGIVYAGATLAFGCWQASRFVTKFGTSSFSLPFSDTEHMLANGWLQGFWIFIGICIIFTAAYWGMKTYREYKNPTNT